VAKLPDAGYGTRNRYLGFEVEPKSPQRTEAIRVTMVSLIPPHDVCNGQQKWVGPPRLVCELSGDPNHCPDSLNTWVAMLQDEKYYDTWDKYGAIYVYDEQIVPDSKYQIQAIDMSCDKGREANYSAPLQVVTSKWGDTVGIYDEAFCTTGKEGYIDCWKAPQGFVDFDDISSTVAKFKNAPNAPQKVRADVCPCALDQKVDFTDIPCVVDGFRNLPYPCEPAEKCLTP
jgi:hypothetical protein